MATKPGTLKRRNLTARHEIKGRQDAEAPRYGQGRGGRPWRRLRDQILERDGYLCQCEDCKRRPMPLPAHEVDHISNVRDESGSLDDSPRNLRAVNRDCHRRISRRQAAEAGHAGTMMPTWMPSTTKPLIVVCGPPSAGKSTWVRERAGPDDLVIDLDDIAPEVIGKPMWESDSRERSGVIRARNDMVADYVRGKTKHPRCYLIDTAGSFRRRKFWVDRGAEIVLLNTDKDVCRQRIMECAQRPESTREGRLAAVDRWE